MSEKLTELQAFEAMKKFLEGYWERTNSDDVGGLLGELQFHAEGGTFDPAAWHDWVKAVEEVLKKNKVH